MLAPRAGLTREVWLEFPKPPPHNICAHPMTPEEAQVGITSGLNNLEPAGTLLPSGCGRRVLWLVTGTGAESTLGTLTLYGEQWAGGKGAQVGLAFPSISHLLSHTDCLTVQGPC